MISRVTRAAFPGLPDSPVGHRIRWYVERLGDPEPPSEDELAANFEPSAKVFAPPLRDRRAWRGLAEQAGGLMEAKVAVRSETEIDLEGTTPEGRRWRYRFAVDPATTRLVELTIEWVQEEDVRVRLATEADGPALADIERRSPLVLGDSRLTIDRGDDYFAASRLMEDVGVALAELDGVPGAVQCAAAHTAHVGGRPVRMAYFHHLRILPEHQRKGLFQKLGQPLSDRYMPPHVDGTYAYVFPDNAASQRLFSFARSWPEQPVMCELPVGRLRGPPAGRPAQPADADTIVDILNTCHGGEEMFCPYSPSSITARLERDPEQYSWGDVLVSPGAVMGVWRAGDHFTMIVDGPDGRSVDREGFALDHGLMPGAEDDYERLLRSWCAHLDDRGFAKLVVFTSPLSPGYPVLLGVGGAMLPFDLYLFGPEMPEGADRRGVYVDAVYF